MRQHPVDEMKVAIEKAVTDAQRRQECDEWFIHISKDWSWLRRACFVATWPLWYLWARVRM